jgi:methylphosphotriester-DNA--protein-cysteine methyltransferase
MLEAHIRVRTPGGALARFVELLWMHARVPEPRAQERMLPTATTELVVHLQAGIANTHRAVVAGPSSEHWTLETSATSAVVGVHFKPGGAFPFFGVPAGELHNARVPLDALWGSRAARMVEEVLAASTPDAKFDALERALLGAARTLTRHRAVGFALRELSMLPKQRTISELAVAGGISQRRLLEHFRDEVGMAPKLFSRVQRFQAVVQSVHPLRAVDWADVAASCGYFDQAHFIHDFRSFSGFAPATYRALKARALNHVPLPT